MSLVFRCIFVRGVFLGFYLNWILLLLNSPFFLWVLLRLSQSWRFKCYWTSAIIRKLGINCHRASVLLWSNSTLTCVPWILVDLRVRVNFSASKSSFDLVPCVMLFRLTIYVYDIRYSDDTDVLYRSPQQDSLLSILFTSSTCPCWSLVHLSSSSSEAAWPSTERKSCSSTVDHRREYHHRYRRYHSGGRWRRGRSHHRFVYSDRRLVQILWKRKLKFLLHQPMRKIPWQSI